MILKNTELLQNHFEWLFHISDKHVLEMQDQTPEPDFIELEVTMVFTSFKHEMNNVPVNSIAKHKRMHCPYTFWWPVHMEATSNILNL